MVTFWTYAGESGTTLSKEMGLQFFISSGLPLFLKIKVIIPNLKSGGRKF